MFTEFRVVARPSSDQEGLVTGRRSVLSRRHTTHDSAYLTGTSCQWALAHLTIDQSIFSSIDLLSVSILDASAGGSRQPDTPSFTLFFLLRMLREFVEYDTKTIY